MHRRTFLKSGGVLLMASSGCQTTQSIAERAPAARIPILTSISSVVPRTCTWTDFSPDATGSVMLLPSGHPSGDIRIVFQAPYPSKISTDIGGQIVLREADGTQVSGEGSYTINGITLAAAKDSFDWDVTLTPPASQRVEPSFQLNIRNVSVNPNHGGSDKTSTPLTLTFTRPPVPDLDIWLAANLTIRDAIVWEAPSGNFSYSAWTAQDRQFFRDTFAAAWNTNFLLLEDPPRNQLTLADSDEPRTVLAEGDAWPLFAAHVCYSLAAEIGGWTSWSITGYSADQLAILLDSREMFRRDNSLGGYLIKEGTSNFGVVPASPWTTLLFLYEAGVYTCRSRLDVIDRVLDWCRSNLVHFIGGFEARNMQDQWQYRGVPPVFRIIQGTPFPGGDAIISGMRHRTAGCWGTTAFLRATLRVLNIPVKHEEHVGHAMPYFTTEGLYLDHGDDPYNRLCRAEPPIPARKLLIDQATRDNFFGNGVSTAQQSANIGRRARELGLEYLSNELLRNRCKDIADNKSRADSDVLKSLQPTFTLVDLEARDLWTQLDAKIASFGGCATLSD